MRLSAFWLLMTDEFGEAYAHSLAKSHVIGAIGGLTVEAALSQGLDPRQIWLALCDDMDVPPERRLGSDQAPGLARRQRR